MRFQILLLLILLLTSCAPSVNATNEPATLSPDTAVTSPPSGDLLTREPRVNPFAPKPSDAKFTRGQVFIEEASLVIRESYPPQISLSLKGNLPTPCHDLRVEIARPDVKSKILAEAYSVADPNKVCTQVLKPFEEYIDLGTFPSGHYSVWVNGKLAGEFDS